MQPFVHRVEVRFRDCDPLGHVNNAVYLTYLEQARFSYWREVWGFRDHQSSEDIPGVILARVECDYKRPATYGEVLEVRMTVGEVGRTSFRFDYEVLDEQGNAVLLAKTVLVMYDYRANKPVAIPDRVRSLLTA